MSLNPVQSQKKLLTGEDLLAMGDVGPCELIDGRIVPMSPTGGERARIESFLGAELAMFVRRRRLGWVLVGEVGIYTQRDPDRVRGADVAFLSAKRAPSGPSKGFLESAPELVVEIVSPGDRWQEMRQKLEEYFTAGVSQVWVVEPENRAVLVYDSPVAVRKFTEGDELAGEGALAGFTISVSEVFAG